MKFKVLLKYVYAEVADSSKNPLANTIHQIEHDIVTAYVTRSNFALKRSDFEALLEADGAVFDRDSLRIYDEDENTYYHITDDFEIQIDPNAGVAEIILWLRPPKSGESNSKVDQLSTEIQALRSSLESQIKEIVATQKQFAEDLFALTMHNSQTMQSASQISNKNIVSPTISLNIPFGKQDSKHSGARSDGDALSAGYHLPLQATKSSITTFNTDSLGLPTLQKKGSYIDSSKLPQAGTIDMAVLYSEPLVRKKTENEKATPLGDPVDFEEECNNLLEILKGKNKRIDLIFQIATKERFIDVLAKAPPILHIVCHGELNQKENKYYLCFESEKGELMEFYSENLRAIIEKIEISPVKLVFVNACHSEEVAKVFLQAGVPCVIAIQSELRIADNVAKKFSQKFYSHIFDGIPVKSAFELAKVAAAETSDIYTCCCAHVHKPNCLWYNDLVKTQSYKYAHQFHTPVCEGCPKKNQHIHHAKCKWAVDFATNYKNYPDEAPLHVGSHEYWTCCCSPDLPHNESLKFKIFNPSGNADSLVLFSHRESGTVTNKNPYSVIEQKFSVKRIWGRNREMHQLFENLTSKDIKYVQLNGSEGVGKTSLVKQLANYLYERGHFRDRISIIMMEKTPSISHFKSDLYKEVGAYDFKSFCESIKGSKNLFILEKCDMLLENHKKEFTETLKLISDAAKYTKFIIIKNEFERLELDETPVMMKDLTPADAAVILINLSYINLDVHHRNPINLADSKLFQQVRLTPQKIWCISERLKNETFNYIEMEMLQRQENSCQTKTEENQEAISKTLESINNKSQIGYNLVLMICLFPSGVSSSDLTQMRMLDVIPINWGTILFNLLNPTKTRRTMKKKSIVVQSESDDEASYEEEEKEEYKSTQQEAQEDQADHAANDVQPGNYFWTVVEKDHQDILYYRPAQFVNKYIDKHLKPEVAQLELRKLQYLTLLALSLIKRMKRAYFYHEKLAENSAVNSYGLWAFNPNNTFYQKYIQGRRNYTYIDLEKEGEKNPFDLTKIMKVFEFHETNFLSCIDFETVQTIIGSNGSLHGETLDLIEICWLAIPTLFKLISTRESGARDLALKALKELDQWEEIKDIRLVLLKAKLRLFLASLYLHQKNDAEVSVSTIHSELEEVEKIRDQIKSDESTRTALSYYVAFTKANCYNRHKKGAYTQSNHMHKSEDIKLKIEYEQILGLLKECDVFLKVLDYRYEIERCKVANLTGSILRKTSKLIDSAVIERVLSAKLGFNVYELKRLEIQSMYIYTQLLLRQKKSGDESKAKELSESLATAKNLFLAKDALIIAQQIKDKSYEAKIVKLIDEINIEIRYGYFNVFVLLRAAPNVEFVPAIGKNSGKLIPKALGFPTRLGSLFKDDIVKSLNERNKLIFLKFDILTKSSLIEALRDGCRILRLNCQEVYPDEDCIVVEDKIGRAERINYTQLKEIFLNAKADPGNLIQQERCFDLLIFATKNGRKTADFFTKELMVQHVITFEFKNKDKDFKHKLYEDECIDRFTQYFYEEIVDGKTITDAFNSAYTRTFDFLSSSFFESKDNKIVTDLIGVGPILLPEGKDHDYALYGTQQNSLPPGKVEDLSKPRCPTNVPKLITPFVGRNFDLDALAELLSKENYHFINISGAPGCGKTGFMLQAAYLLLLRSRFPDGIFYFGLKTILNNKKELTDVMKEVFGSKFENNIKNFFREKKMLIIFDDFDLFYTKNLSFHRLVFCTLKECKIYTIAVTNSQPGTSQGKRGKRQDTEQKQKNIETEFFKVHHPLQPLTQEEMAHILLSFANADLVTYCPVEVIMDAPVLKKLGGNPKLLLEKLARKELTIRHRRLEVNSHYEFQVDIDQVIQAQKLMPRPARADLNLSWHSNSLALGPTRISKSYSMKASGNFIARETHSMEESRLSAKKTKTKPPKHGEFPFTSKGRRKPSSAFHTPVRHSAKEMKQYVQISEKDLENNSRRLFGYERGGSEEDENMLVEDEEEKKSFTSEEKHELNRRSKQLSRLNSRFGNESYSIAELPEKEFNEDLALYSQEESTQNEIQMPKNGSNVFGKLNNEASSDDERDEEDEEEESDSPTEERKIPIIPQNKGDDMPAISKAGLEQANGKVPEEEFKTQSEGEFVKSPAALGNIDGKAAANKTEEIEEKPQASSEEKKGEEENGAEEKEPEGQLSDENLGDD